MESKLRDMMIYFSLIVCVMAAAGKQTEKISKTIQVSESITN